MVTCGFFRLWIARWQDRAEGKVDYAPWQEVAERFPQIPREACDAAVQWLAADGRIKSPKPNSIEALRATCVNRT